MLKIQFELDTKQGLNFNCSVSSSILRVLLTVAIGATSIPWLAQIGQALGWL
jgi:hypothetical protein